MGVNTLDYLLKRFGLKGHPRRMPVEVPGFGRDCLARIFAELGFTEGVEIGVKEGDYSEVLLRENPKLHLRSVDPWLVRDGYRDSRAQSVFDGYEAKARATLGRFGERSEIVKGFSVDVARSLPDASVDFVYIDGHHSFQAATNDIAEWLPKIRPGGIISGHDYARYRNGFDNKAKEVVDAWTAAYKVEPWFVLGRKEKVEGEIRDQHRSFLWVV
jgi:hypothetical protein